MAFTQLNVLSVAPFKVNPPPSAVVSDGVDTFPRVIFLSSTSRLVVLIVVVVPATVKSPGIFTRPAELIVILPTPAVLNVKVSDPPLIPEFVSELKLNDGAEADPSGALLSKLAYVILLFDPVPPPLTSIIGNTSVLAGAVSSVNSDIFLFVIIRI